jgi:FLVCR family feline leukemia virus subgroup C receptor-related protein
MIMDNTALLKDITSDSEYRTYNYRFVISALYMCSAIVSSCMWVCTSPLITNLESIYDLSLFVVNLGTSLNYLIIFIPMSFLANYIIDEMGLRKGILIGNFLTIVGLWVRTFSKDSFYYIFAGQVLGALGAPCILNTPQMISSVWYSPQERTMSTTILSISSPIGVGLGFFLPQLFVSASDNVKGLDQVNHLMFFIAIVGTVLLVPSFFLLKEKPRTPPSGAAKKEKLNYKESLKNLIRNRNFLVFLGGASLSWGTYNVLATVLQPLIANFGYSSTDSSTYGALTLVFGMIGSPIWAIYVGRTKKYKSSLILLSSLSLSMLIVLLFVGPKGNLYVTGAGIALYGFFTTPMLPIMFELCVELTFPVAEANAGGITYMMTQFMGVIGAFSVDAFLREETATASIKAFIFLIILQGIGVLFFVLTKEELRRVQYEQDQITEGVKGTHLDSIVTTFDQSQQQ